MDEHIYYLELQIQSYLSKRKMEASSAIVCVLAVIVKLSRYDMQKKSAFQLNLILESLFITNQISISWEFLESTANVIWQTYCVYIEDVILDQTYYISMHRELYMAYFMWYVEIPDTCCCLGTM